MKLNNYVFVIPGGGGKTTLSKEANYHIDIDKYGDKEGKIETKMTNEWKEAKAQNNVEIVDKLIKDCMNYKAEKLKNELKEENKIILVQSINQAKIILNNKYNIYCFVSSILLQESLMNNRNDTDYVKEICRKQRNDIIKSGWDYKIYNNFDELKNLINKLNIDFIKKYKYF